MSSSIEPLALAPRDAAAFLSISKRSLSRLIRGGKIEARKHGPRTLVGVGPLKAYYASLLTKADHAPTPCSVAVPTCCRARVCRSVTDAPRERSRKTKETNGR